MFKKIIQQRIEELIGQYNAKATRKLDPPKFKISKRKNLNAGMCVHSPSKGEWELSFNYHFLVENLDYMLKQTVPHEVAHYIAGVLCGGQQGHGEVWKRFMRLFGCEPLRKHQLDIPKTMEDQYYPYKCRCTEKIMVSKIRHKRMLNGTKYECAKCSTQIQFLGKE